MYHTGNRALQDRFGSRTLADRLAEKLRRDRFNEADKAFIESASFFFMATADEQGRPDCSFKGGMPGFVKVPEPDLLVFADYDGNGMFKSLGNLKVNPNVGLLFLRIGEKPGRLRVNGRAEMSFNDPMLADFPGGQILVRVAPAIYRISSSGSTPSTPRWKGRNLSSLHGRVLTTSKNWCHQGLAESKSALPGLP
jgi:uncharacterized protein